MSSSPLMAMGIKAMAANYAALQTTSHNIANANVAGYSRQQVELATAQGQFSGAGFFGKGVNVVAVTRTHNEFLTREAADARALAGMDAARLAQLQRLEGIFRTGEAGLGHATNEFLNAMVDLASHPADLAARQVVLARAGELAARFSEAGAALDESQASVTSGLQTSVAAINSLARGIADLLAEFDQPEKHAAARARTEAFVASRDAGRLSWRLRGLIEGCRNDLAVGPTA